MPNKFKIVSAAALIPAMVFVFIFAGCAGIHNSRPDTEATSAPEVTALATDGDPLPSEADAAEAAVESYKAAYGEASSEEFISCEGTDIKPFPAASVGELAYLKYDIDGDSIDELLFIRTEEMNGTGAVIAEVFAFNGEGYELAASQQIDVVDYCKTAFAYFYKDPEGGSCYIVIDSASEGAYTGVDSVSASAYKAGRDGLELIGSWEASAFFEGDDISSELAKINAPFAKNSASIDNTDGIDSFAPLYEVVHTVESPDPLGGFASRVHKLSLVSATTK